MTMSALRVQVFLRAPVPGTVKTRLAHGVGEAAATLIYRQMAEHCIASACAAHPGAVELVCTPDAVHPFFAECVQRHGVTLGVQVGGDLGARMSRALHSALQAADVALLMGSDVPSIGVADLQAAAAALQAGQDAVICPTEDGGYGLIGLRRHDPRVFEGIAWSTPAVLEQTRSAFSALGWRWTELPQRWDVDEVADLERLATLPEFSAVLAGLRAA